MEMLHAPSIATQCFCVSCKVRMRLQDILKDLTLITYEIKYICDSEKDALLRELDLRKLESWDDEITALVRILREAHK